MIAESIAHYRIIKKLGAGGMGEVYLALDTKLDRKVAIKVLQSDSVAEGHLKKRLIREAQAVAKLDHPNICAVYDVSEADSHTFIVMQYIEGETLAAGMERQPLELRVALGVAEQAAEALAEAHRNGIVHRDLKPQNMMITPRGQLKILDFGLAKQLVSSDSVDHEAPTASLLSTPGHVVGTMPYMSPEQLQGDPLDGRSDIFSLGVTFYEMLAGKHPFQGKSAAVTLSRILLADPIPTDHFKAHVSPELQAVLDKMLCKDKAERYQSADELLADLKQLPAKLSVPGSHASQASIKTTQEISTAGPKDNQAGAGGILAKIKVNKWAVLASVLALVVLGFLVTRWLSRDHLDSLAILPFTYAAVDPQLMANPDRDYLSDGLTESIINNLSQLTDLRVIARSSVFRYKGKNLDVQAIGRELNVRAVLVGQIKQEADELRITVELMDVLGNRSIWGATYHRKTADIQTVQNEIAKTVSEKLRMKLTGADQTQLAKTYTESGDAYQAYLKGRYHWNKRTEEGFKQATAFFQEAIVKDPTYALAYTGLADTYTLRSD